MRWQQKVRLGLAIFIVVFVAIVAVALRRPRPPAAAEPEPVKKAEDTVFETHGGLVFSQYSGEKLLFTIRADSQLGYKDGRSVYTDATVQFPDRNGRSVAISAKEAEIVVKEKSDLARAELRGNVQLKTSDGIDVTGQEASYTAADGLVAVPGPVAFRKGRMQGTGVGATYDQNREVLWLLDQARITVAADEKGEGALEATSGAAGLARPSHFIQLTRGGRIVSEGRTLEANDITIHLTEDEERVRLVQLRVNSRITGAAAGAQSMSARDIDLTYGEDGRTLQQAALVDNAVVQLPGDGTGPGRRIAGRTVNLTMAPDGATVSGLVANENAQVDLPAAGDAPMRRIRAARLEASGDAGGLRSALFTGNVEFRETRPAKGSTAAIDRTARSLRLIVATEPGLGAIQQADFRGNAHITDGPDLVADAPRIVHRMAADTMQLTPGEGEPGPQPQVKDARVTVRARTIELTLSTRSMRADTDVSSTLLPQKRRSGAGESTRLPSLLKEDEVVNVTANRLDYDGSSSKAAYAGNARLWQSETRISADRLVLDDKVGNLTGQGNVQTFMKLSEVDAKTKERKTTDTIGRSEAFEYDDAKRLATYTTKARITGAQGDVTADTIELFLKKDVNELERAEAYGAVTVKEGIRTATGRRLTYTAVNDLYVMTGAVGAPVEVVEDKPGECSRTIGTKLTFRRTDERVQMDDSKTQPCGVKR